MIQFMKRRKLSAKILTIMFLIFYFHRLYNSEGSGTYKALQKVTKNIKEAKITFDEEAVLPVCVDKWNKRFKLNSSGLLGFHYDTKPLPPFQSGDLPICRLNSSSSSPIPVILVSLGRSGSTPIWQVVSRLTGHCFRSREYTGKDPTESTAFFSRIKNGDNGNWILSYLCAQQNEYTDKGGIIGFKWKPIEQGWGNKASLDGLRMIGHHTNPPIKVISSSRNPLDLILSHEKHKKLNEIEKQTGKHLAHCSQDDKECINAHKKLGSGIHVTLDTLLDTLRSLSNRGIMVDKFLKKFNVSHIKVSYEKLYQSNDTEEWMRIFRFIGRGPGSNLSKERVEKSLESVVTSQPFHNSSMSNYKEVRDILIGTEFESLLH